MFTMIFMAVLIVLGCGVFVDYWNGSARSEIIYKQTGVRYTWREAAQLKTMYDQQNLRIIIAEEPKK